MKVPAITAPIGTSSNPTTARVAGAVSAHPAAPFRNRKRLDVIVSGSPPEDFAPGIEPVALGRVELLVIDALQRRDHLGSVGPARGLLGGELHRRRNRS